MRARVVAQAPAPSAWKAAPRSAQSSVPHSPINLLCRQVFDSSAEREAMFSLFSLLVKSIHEAAKQKELSQYRNLLTVKKRNK